MFVASCLLHIFFTIIYKKIGYSTKKTTFNSAHTKQSATSEITTTKKTDKEKFEIQTGKWQ